MGLTKEDALKLLGAPERASIYVVQRQYKKLARLYYPERKENLYRREYAFQKFQKIVEAYVRYRIDPDDCDQMKMKEILLEVYSFHDAIASADPEYSDDSDVDESDIPWDDHLDHKARHTIDYSDGPYSNMLRDFTLRSYVSGGGRKQHSFSDVSQRLYVSEEDRKLASQHAEELLKDEEEEKRKENVRKQKNKKKREARKKKKDKTVKPSSSKSVVTKPAVCDSASENSSDELDMDSAFFSRLSSKVPTTTALVWDGNNSSSSEEELIDKDVTTPTYHTHPLTDNELHNGSQQEANNSSKDKTTAKNKSYTTGGQNGSGQRSYYQSELPPRLQKKSHAKQKPQKQSSKDRSTTTNWRARNDTALADHSNNKTNSSVVTQTANVLKKKESHLDKSRKFAVKGNRAAKDGQFEEAISCFTEAIKLYPQDERYFGNRSFCYDYLKDYQRALQDSSTAIKLKEEWPKGHFRRGKALMGLGHYNEAKVSLQRALDLDSSYSEAANELEMVMKYIKPANFVQEKPDVQNDVNPFLSKSQPFIQDYSQIQDNHVPIFMDSMFASDNQLNLHVQQTPQPTCENLANNAPVNVVQSCQQTVELPSTVLPPAGFEKIAIETLLNPTTDSTANDITEPFVQKTNSQMSVSNHEQVTSLEQKNQQETVFVETSDLVLSGQSSHSSSENSLSKTDSTGADDVNDSHDSSADPMTDSKHEPMRETDDTTQYEKGLSDTLWIGNVDTSRIDEKLLFKTFKSCGKILKVHTLGSRCCAFVNFEKPESAAQAIAKYKDITLAGCQLIVRYPDHPMLPLKPKPYIPTGVKGECRYWRGDGCYNGSACHFLHIKRNKGIDSKFKKSVIN